MQTILDSPPGVNRAIVEAHPRGVVTSSTLMANGQAFAEAVDLAQSMPNLSVGCHVVLIDGEPVVEASGLPSLASSNTFSDGLKSFAARAVAGRIDSRGNYRRGHCTDSERYKLPGIHVSHFDTHKHTHVFPQVLRPLLRAAARLWRWRAAQSVWSAVAVALQRTPGPAQAVDSLR